eukprot:CAMPEP_0204621102 /NCGR_PEP_ID=MMETSP0717-20131115/6937_1 /ASSEMBLY_ACC=CAM_ASM_000666 /TAXON_ID=230516 /ORGANISM="Chaetoceros curvisetus" /LENGTH=61 /DNA_ID=CAMNT_0051635453 /DNA_START=64 /DNA_END=249 /DNA_ORIENTATION=+
MDVLLGLFGSNLRMRLVWHGIPMRHPSLAFTVPMYLYPSPKSSPTLESVSLDGSIFNMRRA